MIIDNKRKLIYLNGFEWWLDKTQSPPIIYHSQDSNEGYSIYSAFLTRDESRQLLDYVKYGKNEENG